MNWPFTTKYKSANLPGYQLAAPKTEVYDFNMEYPSSLLTVFSGVVRGRR